MIRNARDSGGETAFPLFVFGPVLALGAVTALIALLAGVFNWYPDLMLATAGVAGATVIVLAVALVYRQAARSKAADRALQSSEARMGDIIDAAMDAIVAVDESQRIVLYNPAAEKVFLWPRDAVLGRPLDMLLPERFRAAHRAHIHRSAGRVAPAA
jgi:PAS domain-containing protein